MGGNQLGGDVYIFINASRNMMKMLRHEEGGMVLYSIRLDMGRMRVPAVGGEDAVSSSLPYENVIGIVRSALDSPYVRRMERDAKNDCKRPGNPAASGGDNPPFGGEGRDAVRHR